MDRIETILYFPLTPVIAWLIAVCLKKKIPRPVVISTVLACFIIICPLLFTHYSYGSFYSYWAVIGIISAALLTLAFNYLEARKIIKFVIAVALATAFLIPAWFVFFFRAYGGDDKVFDIQRIDDYKVVYKREADIVLLGPMKVAVYKMKLFGILQKKVCEVYAIKAMDSCAVQLPDELGKPILVYDPCNKTVRKI